MLDLAIFVAAAALQHSDHAHSATPPADMQSPVEPGQGAFAALGEAVEILSADPSTDWSRVNVEALRAHLVDMDNVILRARATTEKLPNGARFRVTGASDVAASIQNMTRSHFTRENVPGGWTMTSTPLSDGAIVTVTGSAADAQRIQALGFFGILTLDGHHQPHHLMIAKGEHH